MSKAKVVWSCRECGHNQIKWTGSCGGCQSWNTLLEEAAIEEKKVRFESKKGQTAKAVRIS